MRLRDLGRGFKRVLHELAFLLRLKTCWLADLGNWMRASLGLKRITGQCLQAVYGLLRHPGLLFKTKQRSLPLRRDDDLFHLSP